MPLVRITARDSRSSGALDALGDAVHTALVETMNVPPDDRFQIRARVPAAELVADAQYLGIERRDPVIVEISLRAGRRGWRFDRGCGRRFCPTGSHRRG